MYFYRKLGGTKSKSGSGISQRHSGWYPELTFLIVVFFKSTNLLVVIPNSGVSLIKIYIQKLLFFA